jgi:hypothetical protein
MEHKFYFRHTGYFFRFLQKKLILDFFKYSYLCVCVLSFQFILSICMCLTIFVCESKTMTTRGAASAAVGRDTHICV